MQPLTQVIPTLTLLTGPNLSSNFDEVVGLLPLSAKYKNPVQNDPETLSVYLPHEAIEHAYVCAIKRSNVDLFHNNLYYYKFHGLYLNESKFNVLSEKQKLILSKFRRMFIDELIKVAKKYDLMLLRHDMESLLDIKFVHYSKKYVIWNKKESYRNNPKYQQMLQELGQEVKVIPLASQEHANSPKATLKGQQIASLRKQLAIKNQW